MQKVLGLGGVFFKAKDPAALALWYETNLGISRTTDYDLPYWTQERGPTVFEPFPSDTDYFGARENRFMLNFRVADLNAMVDQLRANGNDVVVEPNPQPNGRFARLFDPEGNPLELWQPNGDEQLQPDRTTACSTID
jgi:glyoxylase I family protein